MILLGWRFDEQGVAVTDKPRQRSLEEVRDQFRASGVSVSDWARARGFSRGLVYQVLQGNVKGSRGAGHHIAVALGLKLPGQSPPSPRQGDSLSVLLKLGLDLQHTVEGQKK